MHQIIEKDWHFDLKKVYILTVLYATLQFCCIYNFPLLDKLCLDASSEFS